MKIAEIRGKDSRELKLDIQALTKEKFQLRFKAASEGVADASRFSEIRKIIARINTVLHQREVAEQQGQVETSQQGQPSNKG